MFRFAPLCAALWLLPACSRSSSPTPPTPTRGAPDHTYTVRGKIEMLPAKDRPTAELVIHHEPIPEFVNPNGTRGMPSMSMPFPYAKSVSLDGLAVGDVVLITFDLWTTPGVRGYEITSITKLPPDTTLKFQ